MSVIAHLEIKFATHCHRICQTDWRMGVSDRGLRPGLPQLIGESWRGPMPNRIGSMIPIGFTALYAMLVVILLSSGPARAADDCLVAPNSQPPLGSHWYYHIDGAERRHCWYLGPESQKVHRAEPEVQPAARSVAPVRTETAGDRLLAAAQVEPPLAPLPRATAASATAQAGVQEIS